MAAVTSRESTLLCSISLYDLMSRYEARVNVFREPSFFGSAMCSFSAYVFPDSWQEC